MNTTVIVLGNEKGGTGKSTTAMHIIVGLLREGYAVGAIDLDARQGTLTRYFDNRVAYAEKNGMNLPQPVYRAIQRSELRDKVLATEDGLLVEADLRLAEAGLRQCVEHGAQ